MPNFCNLQLKFCLPLGAPKGGGGICTFQVFAPTPIDLFLLLKIH